MIRLLIVFFLSSTLIACDQTQDTTPQPTPEADLYFPPLNSDTWETQSLSTLDWDETSKTDLYEFLKTNNTRAFIVLKDGKIVMEEYWGKTILPIGDFKQNSNWYWASAGKTLTAFLVGKAQEEGLLDITKPTSDYLGAGWTSLTAEKEALITIRNQLTMTTGLDYGVRDPFCTDPTCLQYRKDAGEQWFYHNAPYTLLDPVVEQATSMDYNDYMDAKLQVTVGIQGNWVSSGYNKVYWSTARDAARFGLLILNKGDWAGQTIMQDKDYFEDMVTSSQSLNPAYGYLWWLNGKSSVIFPGLPNSFPVELAPNAPADLFAAMGKNGQIIDIVPSQNLVVVRMGESPDGSLVPVAFHDEMWEKLMLVMN
jgi:CubicO group peptidase (beta-lactamase class C family)